MSLLEARLKIAFDIELMRPGCALIQAAMGGTQGIANHFDADKWLIAPTTSMKLYEVNEYQLVQLVQKVEEIENNGNI